MLGLHLAVCDRMLVVNPDGYQGLVRKFQQRLQCIGVGRC